jgi:GTP-binding protein
MTIKNAKFIKSAIEKDLIFQDGKEQVAFIGRSNVGKSSLINTITAQKGLAKTSSFPGRTQQINIFLINDESYIIDLPGYGFAKLSKQQKSNLENLVNWYLFVSNVKHKKIILIIDAKVGPTKDDLEILEALESHHKDILIIANKIDKLKKSELNRQLKKIELMFAKHKVIPFSSEKHIGISELLKEL